MSSFSQRLIGKISPSFFTEDTPLQVRLIDNMINLFACLDHKLVSGLWITRICKLHNQASGFYATNVVAHRLNKLY